MALSRSFHGAAGRPDFLGLRRGPRGRTEIVYDAGEHRRTVLRLTDDAHDETAVAAVLSHAIDQPRVFPALLAELRARAIAVEVVAR
ncbi:MAG: hypothetical protein ACK4S2_13615 [Gemmobacter sp.]|uniref:hypothetical protein n=1 Tax=Gemmobacter sp. TaxID=1898957 RepID=UPI003919D8A0